MCGHDSSPESIKTAFVGAALEAPAFFPSPTTVQPRPCQGYAYTPAVQYPLLFATAKLSSRPVLY